MVSVWYFPSKFLLERWNVGGFRGWFLHHLVFLDGKVTPHFPPGNHQTARKTHPPPIEGGVREVGCLVIQLVASSYRKRAFNSLIATLL